MTTEELHNFNIDTEEFKNMTDFLYLSSVINPNEDCGQEIKRGLKF